MIEIRGTLYEMRNLVLSWNLSEIMDQTRGEEGRKTLLGLLSSRDRRVRLRALYVLDRLVEENPARSREVCRESFEDLISMIRGGNDAERIKSLALLNKLFSNVQPSPKQFERLVLTILETSREFTGAAWVEAADLVRKVSFLVVPESIMPLLRQGLSAKCQRTSALSAFLIVRGGNPAGDIDRVLSSAIRRALNSREVVTVELGLDTLEEIMSFPPTRGVIEALVYVLPELWSLSSGGKSVFIRYRARELLESISGRLREYYLMSPEDFKSVTAVLLMEGEDRRLVEVFRALGLSFQTQSFYERNTSASESS